MKINAIVLSLFAFIIFSGCDEFSSIGFTFDDMQASDTFEIDTFTFKKDANFSYDSDTFRYTDFQDTIESMGYVYDIEKLSEFKITEVSVDLIKPETADFGFFGGAAVMIYSANHPELVEIGKVTGASFVPGSKKLFFTLSETNIAPQLKDDWYRFKMTYLYAASVPVKLKAAANFKYSIKMLP
ncbi:MAG: hypothetical protein GC181_16300 [Bacteroidetes bacterium]|nr:hypothetical protein [Bacteroidota bacterium]